MVEKILKILIYQKGKKIKINRKEKMININFMSQLHFASESRLLPAADAIHPSAGIIFTGLLL